MKRLTLLLTCCCMLLGERAYGAIALADHSDSGDLGSALTVLTHTIPSGWSSGDLCLAAVTISNNRAIGTEPSGWTLLDTSQVGAIRLYVYWKILESGDINAALSWHISASTSNGNNQIVFLRVTGHDPAAPINASTASTDGSSVTTHVSPSVTTDANDCLIVRVLGSNATTTAVSGDTGTSVVTSFRQFLYQSSLPTAGATGTATYSTASSRDIAYYTIAIKPAAGGSAVPVIMQHLRRLRTSLTNPTPWDRFVSLTPLTLARE